MSNKVELCDNFKRLLALNFLSSWIECADGHIWIEADYDADSRGALIQILQKRGVHLRSKVYEGVIPALDRVDKALELANRPSLLENYEMWADNEYIVPGISCRIDEGDVYKTKSGEGGLG